MNFIRHILVLAFAVGAASGCSTQLEREVRSTSKAAPVHLAPESLIRNGESPLGSSASINSSADNLNRSRLVSMSDKPWIGGIAPTMKRDARLPAVFEQRQILDFGSARVSLDAVAARLTRLTSIPVRIRSDVYEKDGKSGSKVSTQASARLPGATGGEILPLPGTPGSEGLSSGNTAGVASGASVTPVSSSGPITMDAVEMRWDGRLRDFLDHLTNTLSLAWEYQDGTVVIMRLVSETYQVATAPGRQTFALSSGSAGSSGASEGGVQVTSKSATNISTTGTLDPRDSILKNVRDMIAGVPNSFANWSDGTGRMLVTTSKEAQAKVRAYLDRENKALGQRVNVQFDIYSVKSKDNDEQGVDWSSFFNSLNTRYGIQFASPAQLTGSSAGMLTVNATSKNLTATNNAVLSLLAQYGESVQHRPISFTSVQGVWETKGNTSTIGYIKETTPGTASSSGAAGAPGLKTDLITTGDQYSVLPIVQSDSTTLLRFSVTLSDLIGLFDVTTGSGETLQKVQTPQIQAITESAMIRLAPGETAIVSGLSRHVAKRSENRLGKDIPLLAGGSRSAEIATEHLLILVRATPL